MSESALRYAVRGRVVVKYLGQLGLVLAALTLVPLGVALGYGQFDVALRYAVVILALVVSATPASRLPAPEQVQTNEVLAAIALAFVLSPLLMTWPLMAEGLGFVDTFFEAVSAVTTTGLTTLHRVQIRTPAFLFARSWMQWYGGLGFVVLSAGILAGSGIAWRRQFEQEASGESIITTTRTHARRVFTVYALLTAAGIAALLFLPVRPLDAVTHALSAISTGGFSTRDESLGAFAGTAVPWVVTALSLCGALPLVLYYWTYRRGWREVASDPELPLLLLACAVVSAALFAVLQSHMGWTTALRQAVLLGVSAQTTTGYSGLAVAGLGDTAKTILILAMASGGCVGSTAGGIKLLRVAIAAKVAGLAIRRTGMPAHAVAQARLAGRPLDAEDVERALLLIVLYLVAASLSWLVFLAFGRAPVDSLFEVVSALGTVGLSSGITGADLHPVLKAVLCFDMLAGRLEIVAMLVLLYPGTWSGRKAEAR